MVRRAASELFVQRWIFVDGHKQRERSCCPANSGFSFDQSDPIRMVPCSKTFRKWCREGFDSWLESQNGSAESGAVSWTHRKNSKFSLDQVLQWFTYKDALYKVALCGDEESMSDTSTDEMGKKLNLNYHDIIMLILLQVYDDSDKHSVSSQIATDREIAGNISGAANRHWRKRP
jgi:hypothetical protein